MSDDITKELRGTIPVDEGQRVVRRPEAAEGLQNRPSRTRCDFHAS